MIIKIDITKDTEIEIGFSRKDNYLFILSTRSEYFKRLDVLYFTFQWWNHGGVPFPNQEKEKL